MSPPREDNYQVAEVSNVTAASNVSTNAVNRIVINTLDEVLSTDDTRTTTRYLLAAVGIYVLLFSTAQILHAVFFDSYNEFVSENGIDQSRLN